MWSSDAASTPRLLLAVLAVSVLLGAQSQCGLERDDAIDVRAAVSAEGETDAEVGTSTQVLAAEAGAGRNATIIPDLPRRSLAICASPRRRFM